MAEIFSIRPLDSKFNTLKGGKAETLTPAGKVINTYAAESGGVIPVSGQYGYDDLALENYIRVKVPGYLPYVFKVGDDLSIQTDIRMQLNPLIIGLKAAAITAAAILVLSTYSGNRKLKLF